MPYEFQYKKKKIPKELDLRVKLSEEQKIEIADKYKSGQYSYQSLANEYGVAKTTVRRIVNPEYNKYNKGSANIDKQKASANTTKYMQRKKELNKKGLLE